VHLDDVAGAGEIGRTLNPAKRGLPRAGVGIVAAESDMELGGADHRQRRQEQGNQGVDDVAHIPGSFQLPAMNFLSGISQMVFGRPRPSAFLTILSPVPTPASTSSARWRGDRAVSGP